MYGPHIYQSKDQTGRVANPARGQLNREMNISLSPFAPGNLVSRNGFGSPVPSQPVIYYAVDNPVHRQEEASTKALKQYAAAVSRS